VLRWRGAAPALMAASMAFIAHAVWVAAFQNPDHLRHLAPLAVLGGLLLATAPTGMAHRLAWLPIGLGLLVEGWGLLATVAPTPGQAPSLASAARFLAQEPAGNGEEIVSPLRGLSNVILTPHIGGSTAEAQARIGNEVARKLVEHSDIGTTAGAVNFPNVQLPARPAGTRFMHVHRNTPGILARVVDVFVRRGLNIGAQFLQTDEAIGYVVVDVDNGVNDTREILNELRDIDGTIRCRFLYDRH
jgi:hypothetical protein